MKIFSHPGTPCEGVEFRDLESSIIGENLEAVKCNDGFGVFGEEEYWLSEGEFSKLEKMKDVRVFDYPVPKEFGWGFTSPIDLTVELTKDCKLRCRHCWNESGKGTSLDYERLKEVTDEFRSRGGQVIRLVGGEPLCYDNFFPLLDFIKEKGIPRVEITTNGTMFQEGDTSNLSNYLSHVNLSIHGDSPAIHDSITRSKGSFEKATRTLEGLTREGIDTTIYFTYMPFNRDSIGGVMDLAKQTGSRIKFSFLQNQGRALELRSPTKEKIQQTSRKIIEEANRKGIRLERSGLVPCTYEIDLDKSNFYGCSGMRKSLYVTSEGDVYPCELFDIPIANIYKGGLIDAWNSQNAVKFRDLMNCVEKESCEIECAGRCKASIKDSWNK